jgi:hypothetical protein
VACELYDLSHGGRAVSTRDDKAIIKPASTAVDRFSEGVHGFLDQLGLPSTDVLVPADERVKVFRNLPELVGELDEDQRGQAMYLSKFVAACGAGLFDAALNFIWDEVVSRLRARVARFDLAYFFDTAVSNPQERKHYQTEEDLRSLADAALIQGALKCGMLTEIAYKHLDYIRDMRNWASAAHPNHVQLTGFQLIAWCETCVRDVILKEPEGEVLVVGRLLHNVRTSTFAPSDVPAIASSIRRLPADLAAALLRSIVGQYADPRQDVRVRDNIKLIASAVWVCAPEAARNEVGVKHANFAANGDVDRRTFVHEFLDLVGGLAYLPEGDRANEIADRVRRLEAAHDGWDNFYNEPPVARELRKYVGGDGAVPPQINDEYVRVVVRCRIGRPSGVARQGRPIYDELLDLFGDAQIRSFVGILAVPEIATRLTNSGCASEFRQIVDRLSLKVVDQPTRRVFQAMKAATDAQLPFLNGDTRFRKLVEAV